MNGFQDDIFHQIDLRMERRNLRRSEKLLAWVEVLDALGWKVALRLPGPRLVLSPGASAWLREKCGEDPSWEDLGVCLAAEPPARHAVDTTHVHVWAEAGSQGAEAGAEGIQPTLTKREKEVSGWLREGKTAPEIAVILGLSRRTIESHVARIYRKLGVRHRTQIIFRTDLSMRS